VNAGTGIGLIGARLSHPYRATEKREGRLWNPRPALRSDLGYRISVRWALKRRRLSIGPKRLRSPATLYKIDIMGAKAPKAVSDTQPLGQGSPA
jgi:hypothetical protein